MKTIYFVRHGEAEGNATGCYQLPTTPLTKLGHEQAALIADRAAHLPIEAIVCSPFTRPRQTAEAILHRVKKPIEYSDLFVERIRPTKQRGQPKTDPEVHEIDELIAEHWEEAGWHHSDEENFEDLKKRAAQALSYLENRPEEHVLVIGHALFTCMLAGRAMFGEDFSASYAAHMIRGLRSKNTGLTLFKYTERDEEGLPAEPHWHIWSWNDHTHLG